MTMSDPEQPVGSASTEPRRQGSDRVRRHLRPGKLTQEDQRRAYAAISTTSKRKRSGGRDATGFGLRLAHFWNAVEATVD